MPLHKKTLMLYQYKTRKLVKLYNKPEIYKINKDKIDLYINIELYKIDIPTIFSSLCI